MEQDVKFSDLKFLKKGNIIGVDSVTFWTQNAKQAASYFTSRFGFEYYAYQGLETGNRDYATHVVKNGQAMIAFQSSLKSDNHEFNDFQSKIGDGIKDISFQVDDVKALYQKVTSMGAKGVKEPQECKDENGSLICASILAYGQITHTFVQRDNYKGLYLPGFIKHNLHEPFNQILDQAPIERIEGFSTIVQQDIEQVAQMYEKYYGFKQVKSLQDTKKYEDIWPAKFIVLQDKNNNHFWWLSQPYGKGETNKLTQEFIRNNGIPAINKITFATKYIRKLSDSLRLRGAENIKWPNEYYENLEQELHKAKVHFHIETDELWDEHLLIDYHQDEYGLVCVTKIEGKQPLFLEFTQRKNLDINFINPYYETDKIWFNKEHGQQIK